MTNIGGGGGGGTSSAIGLALDDERFVVVRVTGAGAASGAVVAADEPLAVGLSAAGEVLVGSAASSGLGAERVARSFVSALGRAEPFLVGGTPYGAEALVAQVLRAAVDGAGGGEGEGVALASPVEADDRYRGDLVAEAVRLAGVGDVVIVPDGVGAPGSLPERAEAAARSLLADARTGRRVLVPPSAARLPLVGAGAALFAAGTMGAAAAGGADGGSSLADFAAEPTGDGSSLADFAGQPTSGGSSLGDFAGEPTGGGGPSLGDFAARPAPPAPAPLPMKPKPRLPKPVLAAVAAVVAVAAIATVAIVATSGSEDEAEEVAAPATTTTEAETSAATSTTAGSAPTGATDAIPFRFAGTGEPGLSGDGGPALEAELTVPLDVAAGADGRVYIVDREGPVRVVERDGTIVVLFDGPVDGVPLKDPEAIAVAPDGTVYVADVGNTRILRRTPDGTVTRIAGAKAKGFPEDGDDALEVTFGSGGVDLAVGPDGNLVVADPSTRDLYRIVDGRIRVVLGGGENRADRDGLLALDAHVDEALNPSQVDVAPNGDVIIASRRAVWRIGAADGRLRRLAGTVDRQAREEETGGPSDPARETPISVRAIAVRDDGSVLIAEIQPYQLRLVGTDGTLRPFATGTGSNARPLFRANGIDVGPDGSVYLASGLNLPLVIQKLPPAGSIG